ncbi:MAG: sulfate adenylyltransferase subunit CysD [Bacteroidia bacterium]
MQQYYLKQLESESIYILREAAGQFRKAAILFSGGKDSATVLHLAYKAFAPAKIPFILLHIDTGQNFPEVIQYRDEMSKRYNLHLEVRYVEDSMKKYHLQETPGKFPSRNALQTYTLLDAIQELELDACIGGARRDEEKARAKERIFSFRDAFGQWEPKQQRPELWNIYNGMIHKGENIRVFPISNWTELDVWHYIQQENIPLPSIYFSHKRKCVKANEHQWLAYADFFKLSEKDVVEEKLVRFRTVGDISCTAAVESVATSIEDIIQEIKTTKISERGATRLDDKISDTGMEDRKKQGYF